MKKKKTESPQRNITERKLAEESIRKRAEESQKLAVENAIMAEIGRIISSSLDIEEVYERFAEEVRKLIPVERLSIAIGNPEEGTLTTAYISGLEVAERKVGDIIPIAGTTSEKVIQTRSNLLINEQDQKELLKSFPGLLRYFQAGFRAMMVVPLISKAQVVGVLHLRSTKPGAYGPRELNLAERVGNQIAGAIGNARLFAELKQAEMLNREQLNFLQTLIDTIPSPIYYKDKAGKFLGCNKAWERLNGVKREEMVGKTVHDLFPPELASVFYSQDEELFSRGGVQVYESVVIGAEGTKHDVIFNKAPFTKEDGTVGGLVGVITDITERRKAEKKLQENEEKYRRLYHEFETLLDAIPDHLTLQSPELKIKWANRGAAANLGKDVSALIGRYCYQLWHNRSTPCDPCPVQRCYNTGEIQFEERIGVDGRIQTLRAFPLKEESGRITGVIEVGQDITKRRQMEKEKADLQEQLLQSQKMEAIGKLAGGVAHDFNNLLTVILGNIQLLLLDLEKDDPVQEKIKVIKIAAERAADLTRQLLAFSRRQIMEMKVVNLNVIMQNLERMLQRVIGEDIELRIVVDKDLGKTKGDPRQIEQVVLNLAVNAKDAMPTGGKLTIETSNVVLDENFTRAHAEVKPGCYVMFSMSDTGVGMTPEVREKIFEPFYTTKEVGKGTGLGLSTVYGIVKQSGGHIFVDSEPGQGTTFKVFLPRVDEPFAGGETKKAEEKLPQGKGTILVVEDDLGVRDLAVQILQGRGYKVLEARSGGEALKICSQEKGKIDLLVTDVVMPGISGRQLADGLLSLHPEMKVLFMSGYTDDTVLRYGVMQDKVDFIQKPFSVEALAGKIREVLGKAKS